ncbi:MAG: hypothetical protein ACREJ5_27770, partial [Geminicoccaceae bacterium]
PVGRRQRGAGAGAPARAAWPSVEAAAWSRGRAAVAQTGHLVLDFQFFSLEAGEEQVVRQGAVHLSVDLLLEKGVLVSKALDVILHGHPFAILQLESLTTLSI